MKIQKNYNKYILKRLDDSIFKHFETNLIFKNNDHTYYLKNEGLNNVEDLDKYQLIYKLVKNRKLKKDEKNKIIKKIVDGEIRAFSSVSSRYGYAGDYFKRVAKNSEKDFSFLKVILKKAADFGNMVHKEVANQLMNGTCDILPSNLKPCLVEQILCDPEALIAGTVDLIGWNDLTKKFFVLDWKTSRRYSINLDLWKYEQQLRSYARLFKNNFNNKFTDEKEMELWIGFINKKTLKVEYIQLDNVKWDAKLDLKNLKTK